MSGSSAKRAGDTLKIGDETNGDTKRWRHEATPTEAEDGSSAIELNIHNSILARDEDDDAAEADEARAEAPTADDKTTELWSKVEAAQADLDSLPKGHENTSERLCWLANCKLNYHIAMNTKTEEPFLEALGNAIQARDIPGADVVDQSLSMYMQMVCCYSLYTTTKLATWLHKSVSFGRECIDCMDDVNYPYACKVYSARCEHLAGMLQRLYEVKSLAEHIAGAVEFIGKCVDNTHPDEYRNDGESGDFLLYTRYKKWVELCVRQMDHQRDPIAVIRSLQGLIDQVTERLPCSLDKDVHYLGHNYWFVRLGLHCRQWAKSKDHEHLQLLRQRTRELIEWENNDPFCNCHANKDDLSMSGDPNDPLQVIRRAAGFFDEWFGLDDADGMWSEHIATIDTSIALWEEASKSVSRLTFADLKLDLYPTSQLRSRFKQKYMITGNPRDGWEADNKEWEACQIGMLHKASNLDEDCHPPGSSIVPLLEGRLVSAGSSCVTNRAYNVHPVLELGKPWHLDTQRFKFVAGDDPIIERWIRERSDDGEFVLGGALEGRDDDVFEFLADYETRARDTSQAPTESASTNEPEETEYLRCFPYALGTTYAFVMEPSQQSPED